jgi:hypothetical protein
MYTSFDTPRPQTPNYFEAFSQCVHRLNQLARQREAVLKKVQLATGQLASLKKNNPQWEAGAQLNLKALLHSQWFKFPLVYVLDYLLCQDVLAAEMPHQPWAQLAFPALILGLDFFLGAAWHQAIQQYDLKHRRFYPWPWLLVALLFTLTVPIMVGGTYQPETAGDWLLKFPFLLLSWLGHVAIIFDPYLFMACGFWAYCFRMQRLNRRAKRGEKLTAKLEERFYHEWTQLHRIQVQAGDYALPEPIAVLSFPARQLAFRAPEQAAA